MISKSVGFVLLQVPLISSTEIAIAQSVGSWFDLCRDSAFRVIVSQRGNYEPKMTRRMTGFFHSPQASSAASATKLFFYSIL
jgi:hypothetical protein